MRSLAMRTLVLVIIVVIIVASIGVYYYYNYASPSTTSTNKPIKVAILFDVGGRGDLSFNDMAWLGAEKARKDFNIQVEYTTPQSQAKMQDLLESLSASGEYDLIVLVGFLWTSPLNATADKYPNQKYALIDSSTFINRPNEVDILFSEQEAGALVGVLAADMASKIGCNKVGAVAGMSIPPLWRFHIGYLFGVKYYEMKTNKTIDFLWEYTGTFGDTQKGYQYATSMLQERACVLYGLAGLTHVGMFDAVRDWNKQGKGVALAIGQDASQEWYMPRYMPISGAKRVDIAVYDAIKMVAENKWTPGIHVLGLKDSGVGIWDLNGVKYFAEIAYNQSKLETGLTPDDVVRIVNETRNTYITETGWNIMSELEQLIISGQIAFKNPSTEEEYTQIVNALKNGDLNAALSRGSV
ncbi:BMP family lipoprotein [Desulfurococcus amylolyticus]|uniref:Membrane lipoprotein family protein n=1 Tax=Desulfurococcus amylolyticus (strain DSM 18924 / JCM 16383 / VKM B-2413 / 1221n) TaxID=490899 RepID=B8D6J0_DESA1|nr:BMP family protein [Desulfurococcus amylolyticus]ACL11721.1 Membrane lipoprotein family protein [Desulfurococcus amylolyticus 1221n]